MSGTSFSMDLGRLFAVVDGGLRNMGGTGELASSIGESLVSSTLERFEESKDPDGNAWTPSARAWGEGLKGKARRGLGLKGRGGRGFGKTLVNKGLLRGSITYEATPQRVVVGTNVVYAAIHQFGGMAGRGRKVRIPARPYVGISEEDVLECRSMMTDFLAAGFGS